MQIVLLQIPPFSIHGALPHTYLIIKVFPDDSADTATDPGHTITPMLCFVTQQTERKNHLFDIKTK
jgi:hypothetical protein